MDNASNKPGENLEIGLENNQTFLSDLKFYDVKNEFLGRVISLVIASLALVVALAWEKICRRIFIYFFDGQASLFTEITYTLLLTLLVSFISVFLGKRYLKKMKRNLL